MIVSKHKIVVAKTRATTAMKSVNHVTTLVTTTPTAIRRSAISRPARTRHNATLQHVLSASKATMTTARTAANVHHAKPVQHALSVPSAMSVQHVNCVQHVKHLNYVMRATLQHQSKHQPMKSLVQHATRATTIKTMSALFVLNVKSVRRILSTMPRLTLKNLM